MKRLAAVIVCLWSSFSWLTAQQIPDLSGTWTLDLAPTRVSARPRRDSTAYTLSIRQHGTDVTIVNPIARWGEQEVIYSIGVGERVVEDLSLGTIPGSRRLLRTEAVWNGNSLTLKTTPFGEQRNRDTGSVSVPAGAITSVNVLRLVAGLLTVDTTGFRERPPALLHGIPYDPALDAGLGAGFTEVFRASRR